MLAINIVLVIIGMAIPIGTGIFWSMVKKRMVNKFENKSHNDIILSESITDDLAKRFYHHRSKFNIIMTIVVTIIEFFALMQF